MLSILVAAVLLQASGAAAQPPAPTLSVITQPDWMRRPSGEEVTRYYPEEAQRKAIEGRATIACSVDLEGALRECKVIEESPIGMGFGEGALKLAPLFRMRPATRDGSQVAGGTIRIPIRFSLPGHMDPLSAMFACYGQTAAAAERDPTNAETNRAFAVFAAQVATLEAASKTTPEAFENGLVSARKSALAGNATSGPSLSTCLGLIPKSK